MEVDMKKIMFKYKGILLLLSGLIILQIIVSTCYPYLTKFIIDDVLINQHIKNLKYIILFTLFLVSIQIPINIGVSYYASRWTQQVIYDLRLSLSRIFLAQKDNSKKNGLFINTITNDCEEIGNQLLSITLNSIPNFLLVIVYVIVLIQLSFKLTLIALLVIPIFIVASVWTSTKVLKLTRKVQAFRDTLVGFLNSYVRNKLLIDLYKLKDEEQRIFRANIDQVKKINISTNTILSFFNNISGLLTVVTPLLTLFLGSIMVINNQLTIGSLIAFNSYVSMLFVPIGKMLNLPAIYAQMRASVERVGQSSFANPVYQLGKYNYLKLAKSTKIQIAELIPYVENRPLFNKEINFDVYEGDFIRIVGPNGSGKSILLKCLLYYHENYQGSIAIQQNENIVYVPQENFLFEGDVFSNLTKGLGTWEKDEVNYYIELFQFDVPLTKQVTPFTMDLSSGQLQKIKLIRALLSKPDVLLLDETLANLDYTVVRNILHFLKCKKITTIFVYHGHIEQFMNNNEYTTIDLSGFLE